MKASTHLAPRVPLGIRLLHTMLRVRDLDRSLAFYADTLGMTLFRREDYSEGALPWPSSATATNATPARSSLRSTGTGPRTSTGPPTAISRWRWRMHTPPAHVASSRCEGAAAARTDGLPLSAARCGGDHRLRGRPRWLPHRIDAAITTGGSPACRAVREDICDAEARPVRRGFISSVLRRPQPSAPARRSADKASHDPPVAAFGCRPWLHAANRAA